ncbi:helix-turn-helix domain-containing protein [Bacillus subtilis]
MYMEIKQLLKQGFSQTKIAEKLGVSRTTVYRHLKRSLRRWRNGLILFSIKRKN